MNALIHAHSGLRYVVLILLLLAIYKGFSGMKGKKFGASDKKTALFAMISCHIQLLIGLVLYFFGQFGFAYTKTEKFMSNSLARFWGMEHIVMMVIGIALITIGYSKSKKASTDKKKFKSIAVLYTLGLLVILAAIPWPFRESIARGWF